MKASQPKKACGKWRNLIKSMNELEQEPQSTMDKEPIKMEETASGAVF
jgi:hypothetical protein